MYNHLMATKMIPTVIRMHMDSFIGELRKYSRRMKGIKKYNNKTYLCYPVIRNTKELSDICNRLNWYIPFSEIAKPHIVIPVSRDLLNISIEKLKTPKGQQRYLASENQNIALIPADNIDFSKYDRIILSNIKGLANLSVLKNLNRVNIVDKNFYYTREVQEWDALVESALLLENVNFLDKLYKQNYATFTKKHASQNKCYLFCSGSSVIKAYDFDFRGGLRVICNGVVLDKKLLQHINPNVVCITDHANFFGPSRNAAEYRRQILEIIDQYKCYLIVPAARATIYLTHYPRLKEKIIGIPAGKIDKFYEFVTPSNFYINIAKSVLFPMIQSVADNYEEIYFIGADGNSKILGEVSREKDVKRERWKHSCTMQLSKELQVCQAYTHPSLERDREKEEAYHNFFENHYEKMETIISYGERKGKRFYSLTESHIPALKKRLYK